MFRYLCKSCITKVLAGSLAEPKAVLANEDAKENDTGEEGDESEDHEDSADVVLDGNEAGLGGLALGHGHGPGEESLGADTGALVLRLKELDEFHNLSEVALGAESLGEGLEVLGAASSLGLNASLVGLVGLEALDSVEDEGLELTVGLLKLLASEGGPLAGLGGGGARALNGAHELVNLNALVNLKGNFDLTERVARGVIRLGIEGLFGLSGEDGALLLDLFLGGVGEPERATADSDEEEEDGDQQDTGAAPVELLAGAPAHTDGQAGDNDGQKTEHDGAHEENLLAALQVLHVLRDLLHSLVASGHDGDDNHDDTAENGGDSTAGDDLLGHCFHAHAYFCFVKFKL